MIPHKHSWITARSLDVCRWCLRRRSPRDGHYPRVVLKEKLNMTEKRSNHNPYLALALVALLGLASVLAVALVAANRGESKAPRPQPHWIYGPRTTAKTGQPGVIVACQDKTNSLAFARRKHATPGDVYIMTCRAERG